MKIKYLSSVQKFIKAESLSGILLFSATVLALVFSNLPFHSSYDNIWNYKIGIKTENFELIKPVILWINDGLMAIFFFLIGLEIKREILIGELNSLKKASLPVLAALGGMIIAYFLSDYQSKPRNTKRLGHFYGNGYCFYFSNFKINRKKSTLRT